MSGKKRSISLGAIDVRNKWDEALCPICMEHPHNAVLLQCSSHAKGCRSYICDTSYRHSNCLDRFRKLKTDSSNGSPGRSSAQSTSLFDNVLPEHLGLKCPLCRGDVLGWAVVEEARKHLNKKPRSCTRESCTYVGNYHELRMHARNVHPRVRPAEVDPSRERVWRRFEDERENGDVVSAITSAMPGAIVLGDYIIENSDGLPVGRERTSGGDGSGPWWRSTLFFLQMLESVQSMAGPRSHSRPWMRHRPPLGGSIQQQRQRWREHLLGLQDDGEDGDVSVTDEEELNVFADVSAARDTPPVRRQRRRLTRSRSSRDRS